jgi:hypothetical protein
MQPCSRFILPLDWRTMQRQIALVVIRHGSPEGCVISN